MSRGRGWRSRRRARNPCGGRTWLVEVCFSENFPTASIAFSARVRAVLSWLRGVEPRAGRQCCGGWERWLLNGRRDFGYGASSSALPPHPLARPVTRPAPAHASSACSCRSDRAPSKCAVRLLRTKRTHVERTGPAASTSGADLWVPIATAADAGSITFHYFPGSWAASRLQTAGVRRHVDIVPPRRFVAHAFCDVPTGCPSVAPRCAADIHARVRSAVRHGLSAESELPLSWNTSGSGIAIQSIR